MLLPNPALLRLAPVARPLVQAWSFYATTQVADAIVDANPGWSLPSGVAWAAAQMFLALLSATFVGLVATSGTDACASSGLKRLRLAAMALLIGLLLGLVVAQQPTILLPALGLALAYHSGMAPLRTEARP